MGDTTRQTSQLPEIVEIVLQYVLTLVRCIQICRPITYFMSQQMLKMNFWKNVVTFSKSKCYNIKGHVEHAGNGFVFMIDLKHFGFSPL